MQTGREISCKAAVGKYHLRHARCLLYATGKPGDPTWRAGSIPQYGDGIDTTDGSKKVKISNKEVGVKKQILLQKKYRRRSGKCGEKRGDYQVRIEERCIL